MTKVDEEPPADRPHEPGPPRWMQGVQSVLLYFGLVGEDPPAVPKPQPTGWGRVWAFVREWWFAVFFIYLLISSYRDRDYGVFIFAGVVFALLAALALLVKLRDLVIRRRGYPTERRSEDHPPADR